MSSQGGGFMDNRSSTGGDNQNFQQAAYQQSYRALTVRQATEVREEHGDAQPEIDGVPVVQACIAGIVRDVKVRPSGGHLDIRIEDQTGTLDTIKWNNSASGVSGDGAPLDYDTESEIDNIRTGHYAIFYGHIRGMSGRRRFTVLRIDQDVGPYQILYHEMQALREHLANTGRLPWGAKAEANAHDGEDGPALFVGGNGSGAIPPMWQRVRDIVLEHSLQDGIETEYLAREIDIPTDEMRRMLHQMQDGGMVYAADEEDVWKITDYSASY